MSHVTPVGFTPNNEAHGRSDSTTSSLATNVNANISNKSNQQQPSTSTTPPPSGSLAAAMMVAGGAAGMMTFSSLTEFRIPETSEGLLTVAKMAELCERWDEMLVCMKRLAKQSALEDEFGSEERQLLHVAYRQTVLSRRSSWRVAKSAEQKAELEAQMDPNSAEKQSALRCAQEFRVQLETEITDVCTDLIILVENIMFPVATGDEAKMFLFKLAGDFYRYLAEVNPSGTFAASVNLYQERPAGGGPGSETPLTAALMQHGMSSMAAANTGGETHQDEYWVLAQEAYARATELASSLRPSHPTRLGIALNLSIFYYETMRNQDKALHLAREAFSAAIGDETPPETVLESESNEAGAILQLLQENLFFWTQPLDAPVVTKD